MAFTAQDVKNLREITGCGMMDCKKALSETNGDQEKAIEFLREKGLAAAAKKAGRIAAEGIVKALVDTDKKVGVVVEVNAETDFVAKNAEFQEFVTVIAQTIINQNPADVDALAACKAEGTDVTVADLLTEKIQKIGENMKIRRFTRYEGDVATYVHGGGTIGVMVKFNTDVAGKEGFAEMGKDVAMQVAAANPGFLTEADVPAEVLDKEREILKVQAMNEGKPEAIAEKMVAGRIQKFYKENCLMDQVFIKDNELTVKAFVEAKAKELGGKIEVVSFVRLEKGEGLEKKEDNVADEVASMVK